MTDPRPVSSIRRLLIGYLLVMGLLAGGVALGTVLLVRAADRDRTSALIDSDIGITLEKIGADPAMQRDRALAIVLARDRLADERLYRLSQRGTVLAGEPASVRFAGSRDGLLESGDPPALARRVELSDGVELLVGRRLVQGALTQRLLIIASTMLVIAMILAAAAGLVAVRRLGRRVDAINAACDRVTQGDFAARAPAGTRADEFTQLAGHVNGMLERIDTLVAGLRDVSNRIAHDLRTPVARLKTSIDQAAQADALPRARALAGAAAAETDEILQTFEALLDIAEVEAGSTGGLAPMRLDEAVRSALDLYDSVADSAGIDMASRLDAVEILGERMLVIRLAANIVDNAIKFSPSGGRVEVQVWAEHGSAVLRVRDCGPGIAEDDRSGVLRRYQRGETTRHIPGHGLGLALVSAVAKRHGARVALDDAHPGLAITVRFEAFAPG